MAKDKDQEGLTLRLLGEPQILFGEVSLTKSLARKEQALLIYLACQAGQRFSREHLATLLWSEVSHSSARYNLRRALWHLRRTLSQVGPSPEACLVIEGPWIYAPSTAPCWVDIRDFEQVLEACFQNPQSNFSTASEGIRRIRRALDLYEGDFLARFSVPHAPNFEEWVTFERERLFLLLLRALTSLIQGFIARGERDEAIAACQRLLVLDPLQEDIHRLLMRLYWETGQRAQALRQYRTYQDLLHRELGIEPLEDTQDLYQRILQHEVAPTSSSSSLVLTSRLTPPSPPHESLARPRPSLFSTGASPSASRFSPRLLAMARRRW
jgi:DNA-binding SARP family transcriptional activator